VELGIKLAVVVVVVGAAVVVVVWPGSMARPPIASVKKSHADPFQIQASYIRPTSRLVDGKLNGIICFNFFN
jgi:hypothetical protein